MATSVKADYSFDLPITDEEIYLIPFPLRSLGMIKNTNPEMFEVLMSLWDHEKQGLVLCKLFSLTVKENILHRDFLQKKRDGDIDKINAIIATAKRLNMSIPEVLSTLDRIKSSDLDQTLLSVKGADDTDQEVISELIQSMAALLNSDHQINQAEQQLGEEIVLIIMSRYGKWRIEWNADLPVKVHDAIIDFYFGEQLGWSETEKKS